MQKKLNRIDQQFITEYCKKHNFKFKEIHEFLVNLKDHYLEFTTNYYEQDIVTIDFHPSHILDLDLITSGIPSGINQIYGPTDTFKSAFTAYIAAQKLPCFYVKSDPHPFRWNIESKEFIFTEGNYDTNEMIKTIVSTSLVNNIYIDSLSSLNRSLDTIKTTAKLISGNPDLTLFFTNQTRSSKWSETEKQGLDFIHTSCNMIIRIEKIERNLWTGSKVLYSIEKCKPEPKFEKKKFILYFNNHGNLSNELSLILKAQHENIIERVGTKFVFQNKKYSLIELINNIDVLNQIWNIVITPINQKLDPNDYLGRILINKTT